MIVDKMLSGRQKKFANLQLENVNNDGIFYGYASVFNEVDLGQDIILPGAFSKSLAASGANNVRMLFQHDPAEPIGVWTKIHEDERGLFVEGKLTKNVSRSAEVLELMQAGALDGLSIGFETVRSTTDKKTGIRTIIEASLWEISVVTFPMLTSARVGAVNGTLAQTAKQCLSPSSLPTKRHIEKLLTRNAGLPRSHARHILAHGYNSYVLKQDAEHGRNYPLIAKIRQAIELVTK